MQSLPRDFGFNEPRSGKSLGRFRLKKRSRSGPTYMRKPATNLLLIVFITINASAWAEELSDEGKQQYLTHCSGCHGVDGKGAGLLADRLHSRPSDLTNLSKKNKGEFPVSYVYMAIDGRDFAPGHNVSDMPVWGCRHLPLPLVSSPPSSASPSSFRISRTKKKRSTSRRLHNYEEHLNLGCDSEDIIANRILSVIEYLRRIQVK